MAANRHLALITVILFALLVSYVLMGCEIAAREYEQNPSDALARSINQSIMCPVCPGETIDQSQVQLAKQMKALVREKIAAGETRQQILDYFVERYGSAVLAEPIKEGSTFLVWAIPPVMVLFGAIVLVGVVRRMMMNGTEVDEWKETTGETDVSRYLEIVDAKLGKMSNEEETG